MRGEFNLEAYPGETFPVTGKDRVCLLCQQPYDGVAADRMQRFRNFIEDTSQKEAAKEENKLADQYREIRELSLPTVPELDLAFMEISEREQSFAPIKVKLASFLADAVVLKRAILTALKAESKFETPSTLDTSPLAAASEFASALELKAKEFDKATASNATTAALKQEHSELLGRRQLNASSQTILSRLRDIVTHHGLVGAKISATPHKFREKTANSGINT